MAYLNYKGVAMPESGDETDRLMGTTAGGETIQAGSGNVSLAGDGGGDTLIGSSGDNRFFITDPHDVVIEQPGAGIDTEIGWTSIALAPNVENLIVHQDFSYAVGNDLDNLIIVDGNQWVVGGKGDDVLVGSPTQRTTFSMAAGDGNDVIYNWNGNSQLRAVGYGLDTAAAFRAAMTQVGSDVLLKLSATDSVTFRNVTIADFSDRQFLAALDTSKLGALTFDDEFNSLQIFNPSTGTGQWQTNFGGNLKDQWAYSLVSNGETQAYVTPDFQGRGEQSLGVNPFSVSNGVLTITAAPTDPNFSYAAWGRDYTSGMLNTLGSFEQKYGYFEMRAELPTAMGSWSAFWMIPHPYVADSEADVMEALAAMPDVDHRHASAGDEGMYDQVYKGDGSGFHTYGMLWTATTVTFYYDGVAVLQGPTPSSWTNPMALIVNLATGGWGGNADASQFPAELKIDYIRAYALADGSSQVVNGTPERPVDTLLDQGATSGHDGLAMVFQSDGSPVSSAHIQLLASAPTTPPSGKAMLIWEDAGAIYGAVSSGGVLATPTVLMAGAISQFTGSGAWLTDGKVVFSYVMPNSAGGHDLWDMVFDPAKGTFVRQDLGATAADPHAVFVATEIGGFAVSWHAPDGTVVARGYDEYAYGGDVPGWYGPARQITGDLIGVYAQGQVIAQNGAGQEIYELYQASASAAPVAAFASGAVSLAEGASGATAFTYTVTRVGPVDAAGSLVWTVAGSGDHPADGADFVGGVLPSGVLQFAAGEATKTIVVNVAGDAVIEPNETFTVTLSNPVGMTLNGGVVGGEILNDDNASSTGASPNGQTLTSPGPNSTLTGGAGDDVLIASHGGDTLTGGAGADKFVLPSEPWAPVKITDFTVGTDKLDLTALFQAAGYTGTDPVADGRISFIDDGAGGTKVLFDADGPGPNPQWGNYIVQLNGVSSNGLTWSALTNASASGGVTDGGAMGGGASGGGTGGGGATGQTLTSPGPNSTVTGGAGDDVLIASHGGDTLTGGAGADKFVLPSEPWAPVKITDFTVGTDKLDLTALFQAAGYTGTDPVADGRISFIDDGAGGTKVLFDADGPGPNPQWGDYVVQLNGVSSAGLTWSALTGTPSTGGGGSSGGQPSTGSGALVVFAGQSNMGAPYQDASTVSSQWVTDPNIQIWDDATQKWETLQPGVNTGYGTQTSAWGPEVEFAIDFRLAHPGEILRIVKSVAGGTQLAEDDQQFHTDWSPASTGELFDQTTQIIARASAAAGGAKVSAVFYGQGEEDATKADTAQAYGDNLANLFSAIRGHWMQDATGKIGFFQIGTSPSYAADVRAGEARVDQADANATSFDAANLAVQSDGLHFTAASLNTTGDQFFQMFATWTGSTSGGGETTGQTLTSPGPNSTLAGGAGDDVLIASQGGDTLTGGAGADKFVLPSEPWAPVKITDFTVGTDKLDLTALFQAAGYSGTDPVADGHIVFIDDGVGGTKVLFDADGPGPNPQWGNYIVQLNGVSSAGLTWAMLANGASSGGGSGGGTGSGASGQTLTSPGPNSTLTGGAGADTLIASQGGDTLTGGAGADHFVLPTEPWAPVRITDFTVGTDKLDLTALFRAAGYTGTDPVADGRIIIIDDGSGGSKLLFDADGPGPNPQWGNYIVQLDGVSTSSLSTHDWLLH